MSKLLIVFAFTLLNMAAAVSLAVTSLTVNQMAANTTGQNLAPTNMTTVLKNQEFRPKLRMMMGPCVVATCVDI